MNTNVAHRKVERYGVKGGEIWGIFEWKVERYGVKGGEIWGKVERYGEAHETNSGQGFEWKVLFTGQKEERFAIEFFPLIQYTFSQII